MAEQEKTKRKTHTSTQVKRRYIEKNYSRIHADLPKELVANFRELSTANGDTTAGVFREAMKRYITEHPPKSQMGKIHKNKEFLA